MEYFKGDVVSFGIQKNTETVTGKIINVFKHTVTVKDEECYGTWNVLKDRVTLVERGDEFIEKSLKLRGISVWYDAVGENLPYDGEQIFVKSENGHYAISSFLDGVFEVVGNAEEFGKVDKWMRIPEDNDINN